MAEAESDRPTVAPAPNRFRSPWAQGMACLAILPLLGFIGQTGTALWEEWGSLRHEQSTERESAIVGYTNISLDPNFAKPPPDWFREEGDRTLVWSGWKGGQHCWFRIGRGELAGVFLSLPIGKDCHRAIDRPIFEENGGAIRAKVPGEAPVFGSVLAGSAKAYPLKVLDRVEIVNDRSADKPILVVFTPVEEIVSIFEAEHEGVVLNMGHSGYFVENRPVLYDRASSSLWVEQDGSLKALAGPRKGAALPRIDRLSACSWRSWDQGHPSGKLLVGADRSVPIPSD